MMHIAERTERPRPCLDCGGEFPHVTGYVYDSDGPVAVYFGSCHGHEGRAAWLDVIVGTWGVDPPAQDHVTFSCEVRAIGAMAIDAPATLSRPSDLLGVVLTRVEALSHPLLATFWTVVDAVREQDPLVSNTLQFP
jgi:hypothetical protein